MTPDYLDLRWGWLTMIASCSFILGALTGLAIYRNVLVVPSQTMTSGQASVGGPFSLIDLKGRRVTELDFRNRPLIIAFGYTLDQDQTPAALQELGRIIGLLGKSAAKANFAFITLDPRDTPERLADYLRRFDSRIQGLTGDASEIAAVAKRFRIPVVRDAEATPLNNQSITFDALIFLLNSQGIYVSHVSLGEDVMPLIHRLLEVL